MRKYEAEPDSRQILLLMQGSLLRMRDLIDNIADFARSRLGSGLTPSTWRRMPFSSSERWIRLSTNLPTAHPDRSIIAEVSVEHGVPVDHGRIAQLLSNLIGNALSYGDVEHQPVRGVCKSG